MSKHASPELEHISELIFPDFVKGTEDLRRLRTICSLLLDEVNRLTKEVKTLQEQCGTLDHRTIGMVRLGGS
jgi:hypothetical protein